MKGVETKKALSPKQRDELLEALKARFEKNMNRHKGLEWAKVQAKLEANAENCGHSMKWKELVVSQMLLPMIKKQANTFFMIVLQSLLKEEEVYVMTKKH